GSALPDVGDHGAEDDHRGDAHHGEDHAIDEGDDHQVVPGRERLRQVVEQDEVRRPGELQQIRLGERLGGNEENEDEGHHEEDRGDHDGRDADDQASGVALAAVVGASGGAGRGGGGDGFHQDFSPRLSHLVSGTMITVTTRNSTTLPAVDRP